ncbi:MAG: DUF1028 domain-containing protein [Staphylothermus sp.]|nr:DUF1028 domain-containing protein [Staphylothermus sp.]
MTYSIVSFDPKYRFIGIGTVSGSVAVGSRVPWAMYPYGGVATQAYTNPSHGPRILDLLPKSQSAENALLTSLKQDPFPEKRQIAVASWKYGLATFSGKEIPLEKGEYISTHAVCIGNLLTSKAIPMDVCEYFENKAHKISTPRTYAELLLETLMKGHELGGDKRGDQTLALLIVGETEYLPYYDKLIDIRIDLDPDPFEKAWKILNML